MPETGDQLFRCAADKWLIFWTESCSTIGTLGVVNGTAWNKGRARLGDLAVIPTAVSAVVAKFERDINWPFAVFGDLVQADPRDERFFTVPEVFSVRKLLRHLMPHVVIEHAIRAHALARAPIIRPQVQLLPRLKLYRELARDRPLCALRGSQDRVRFSKVDSPVKILVVSTHEDSRHCEPRLAHERGGSTEHLGERLDPSPAVRLR